jgi:hypothetical protein
VTTAKKTMTETGIPITASIAMITMMASNLCADSLPLVLMIFQISDSRFLICDWKKITAMLFSVPLLSNQKSGI